jgi:hypothetical protein
MKEAAGAHPREDGEKIIGLGTSQAEIPRSYL